MSGKESTAFECPGCGATIEKPTGSPAILCNYCGLTVEGDAPVGHSSAAGHSTEARPLSGRVRAALAAGILLATGIGAFTVRHIWQVQTAFARQRVVDRAVAEREEAARARLRYVSHAVFLEPEREGSMPDILMRTSGPAARTTGLTLLRTATGAIAWDEQGQASHERNAVAFSSTRIVLLDGLDLRALDRATGKVAWQATLSDGVACASCMRATGRAILALTKDGKLRAYEADSGKVLWDRRLHEVQERFFLAGGSVVVIDGRESDGTVFLLDPSTGRERRVLKPACTANPDNPYERFEPTSRVLVDEDQHAIYLFYPWSTPRTGIFFSDRIECIQRWDARSGTMVWQRGVDEEVSKGDALLSGNHLYVSVDDLIVALDVTTGFARKLAREKGCARLPLGGYGNTVVLPCGAEDTRTDRPPEEIRGLDLLTGRVLWRRPFREPAWAENVARDSPSPVDPDVEFVLHSTEAGPRLIEIRPGQLVVRTLKPSTGRPSVERTIGLLRDPTSKPDAVTFLGWRQNTALVIAQKRLAVVDLRSGSVSYWAGGPAMTEQP